MKKILILIPLLGFGNICAQLPSVDQWQHLTFENKFLNHTTPLKLLNTDSVSAGHSTLSYFRRKSDFREVYTPRESKGFEIASERYVSLHEWKFYGQFSFSKYQEKGTQFTAMADPFRDNPYKIADSVTNAHWNKQHYFLEARILTPQIIRNVRSGIGIKYEVLNGARQIDPRPSDKLIDLEVTPQLIYQYNQWNVGINGHYSRFREDLNISLQNNQLSKNIYKLLGLAEHLFNGPVILSGAFSRFYQGNTYGGGISVSNKINEESFVQLSGYLKSRKEEVTDGTTTPFNAGHHQMTETGGLITYETSGTSARHQVSLEASRQNSENTEFVQFLNEETFQYEVLHSAVMHEKTSDKAGVSYHALLMNPKKAVSWKLGADITYYHFNEVYPGTASKMLRNHLLFSAHAGKWFTLRSLTLYAGYQTAFKKVGSHDLWFTPNPKTSNFVANQIMYPNYYFNTSDALSHQAHVQLTLPAFEKRQSQLYFKADYENISPVGNQPMLPAGLSNHFFNITVGLYN